MEKRFDNVVFRLAMAASRRQARMLITQGHFKINGKKVTIPSYLLKENDVISIAAKSAKSAVFAESIASIDRRSVPEWLSLDGESFKGTVKRLPTREDVTIPIQEQLIVELYSK